MRTMVLALVCGILLLRWTPSIPSNGLLAVLLLPALAVLRAAAPWRLIGCLLLGWCWACWLAGQQLAQRLPESLDGQTRWIEGRVAGLPEQRDGLWRFELDQLQSRHGPLAGRARLSWPEGPALQAGERWRLAVRLRSPRGLVNPDGFDYEAWLLARGISLLGSVKAGQRLQVATGVAAWRDGWRQAFLLRYQGPGRAALAALVLGDGSALQDADWQVLQATGTLHLLVISGQHIVLVAGLLYLVPLLLYRRGLWPLGCGWLLPACVLALAGALAYGCLAGLGLPVQRALVMLLVVMLWRVASRRPAGWSALVLALLVVLVCDPLASLQSGFWLSFAAVALLIWGLGGRLASLPWWRQLLWIQWLMTLGLLPLLLALGLPMSPAGLLVNLLVVPWVGILMVPLALAGFLLLWLPWLGTGLLWLAGVQLHALFLLLHAVAGWLPLLVLPSPHGLTLLLAVCGVLLHLQPRGLPWRLVGLLLLLPLLWPPLQRPAVGEARVLVMDVGQGLAVWVQTAGHDLLYDAGPRTPGFDAGERILLPLMRRAGVRQLDLLLLSHADQDHAGGAPALLAGLQVRSVLAGEAQALPASMQARPCRDREQWSWDGVRFITRIWPAARESNDQSCVLLVEAAGERLLLTGDIGQQAELALLQAPGSLQADWLLAPHHGSGSSSSTAFIRAVAPRGVLISRGRHNAYRHPHPLVLARYRSEGVLIYDTARDGALELRLGRHALPQGLRRQLPVFWREN